jgi:hypothetical protein
MKKKETVSGPIKKVKKKGVAKKRANKKEDSKKYRGQGR